MGGTLRAAVSPSPVASSLNAGYGGGDVGDRVSSALGVQKYRDIGLGDLKI